MKPRNAPKFFTLLLLVLVVMLSLTSATTAQQPRGSKLVPVSSLVPEVSADYTANAVRLPDGRIQVIVSLSDSPAVTAFINAGGRGNLAAANTAATAQASVVLAQQAGFIAQASALGATTVSSTSYLSNTVTIAINPNQVGALRLLPGVTRVDANRVLYREDTVSMPLIGADEVWTGVGGGTAYTGDGTVVAVIDSGIDYTHTHFGGPGDYAANTDDTIITDTVGLFPAAFPIVAVGDEKVVGGFDYVGNDYDSSDPGSATPAPDPDPLDCRLQDGGGHGSHVAGTVAGWGVSEPGGATYTGPFDNTIYPDYPGWTAAFRIGPGVAPEAALLAMRVFGCDGSTSTSVIIDAIDDSVAGTYGPVADVINMSLGSPFGTADPDDPANVTMKNASDAGTVVVASAGNNGDFFFITGSPAQNNETISVASSLDGLAALSGIRDDTDATIYAATYGTAGPIYHDPVTAIFTRPSPNPDGCLPEDFDTFPAGHIALIDRGSCNFSVKQDNAFAAGAAGIVVANVATSPNPESPVNMLGTEDPNFDIPAVHVVFSTGEILRGNANGANTITMDDNFAVHLTQDEDTISGFSSRGPSRFNANSIKPDIAAPGDTIYSTASGSGTGGTSFSGTSMASPHMAGTMALLKEKYPTWTVAELKALVMNTANNDIAVGATLHSPQRQGAGRVTLEDTFGAGEVIAYNTLNPAGVSVSFAFPEVIAGNSLNDSRTITLENKSGSEVSYDVSLDLRSNMVGVELGVTETTVTIPASSTATVTVTLTGDPNVAGVNTPSDPTLNTTAGRFYLTEESGYVVFQASSGTSVDLRVPVYAAPRVASDMASSAVNATFDSVLGSGTIDLAGTGVSTGALGQNEINSIVSAYQLVVVDPDEAIGSECEPDDYCVNPDAADVQYVGIANNYAAADELLGYTYFAISTYADWYTPHALAFNIYLDGDQDGEAEFMIFNDSPFQNANSTPDAHNVMIQDLTGVLGGAVDDIYVCGDTLNGVNGTVNTYVFNNNVVMIPVCTEDIFSNLVEDSSATFDYWIETKAFQDYGILPEDSALVVDTVGLQSYDPENATYNFTGSLLGTAYADVNGGVISFDYNFTNPVSEVQKDILLLHHHNAGSVGRAEIVSVPLVIPDDFLLLSPGNGEVVTDTAAFTAITWESAASALTYRIVVIKVSNNTATSLVSRSAVGPVLDVTFSGEADADGLTCDASTCTLTVTPEIQALLSDGTYSWTVFASGGAASTEASNAPYTFKVNTGDIELLLNEDFENVDTEGKPVVAPWVVKNGAGDKGKCNKDKDGDGIPDKIVANTGNCAFQFKGSPGENSKLTQAVEDNPLFAQLGLGAGDVLNASIFVNTEIATPGKFQLKVKYVDPTAGANGNGKDKLTVDLAATVGYEEVTGSLTLADEVTKVGFTVKFSGPSGKMYVDDASLIRAAAASTTRTGLGGRNQLVPVPPSSNSLDNSNGLNGKQ